MARPRFQRLTDAQRNLVLDAALEEFAAFGYERASLNRIIVAAGLSKGAMYYYFDGKEDLYSDVLRRQIERLVVAGGPAPVLAEADPDAFWAMLEDYYVRLLRLLSGDPRTAALLRGWLSGAVPAMQTAQHDAERAAAPWLAQAVTAGQQTRAVRTDLAPELIIAVAFGLGQAIDTWLIARPPADHDLPAAVRPLFDLMRRALAP
ncbi:MAG: TetR/AcrR family transcriptional regulator [Actinobacteria bacterium]|nr:TetR/AcrR family transcriptional regulator [Actinomycetota bacterium]